MQRLAGKVALVTGGGGALGGATAECFAAEGAAVIVHDIVPETVEKRVKAIESAGGRALGHVCDVTDSPAVVAMFAEATKAFGVVDVLVTSAGTSGFGERADPSGDPLGYSDEDWSRMLSLHLDGTFYCAREMVRGLVAAGQDGSMVCFSSMSGLTGMGDIHYSTAKGGVIGFVRSVARACGPHGIRANAVCPGVMTVGMATDVPAKHTDPLKAMTPLGRFGTMEDMASACLYLASDESSFVTGHWLSPSGGLVIA